MLPKFAESIYARLTDITGSSLEEINNAQNGLANFRPKLS